MNNLVIPPSANWYDTSILVCAPDNTLIYGSRSDIVIIYDSPDNQPSEVKIIPRAHSQKIISTNINRNWGNLHKYLVTAAEDNIIKLWDIDTRKKKLGHNAHAGHGKVVGATFAGDEKVISVSEDGIIIVWNVNVNKTNVLNNIFGTKVTITCISTCPHANFLTAFGLKNGLVIVTDLRKQGKVLYKLRGHDKSVLSLSWCPAPVNIFPKNPHNYVGVKKLKASAGEGSTENSHVVAEENNADITVVESNNLIKSENQNICKATQDNKTTDSAEKKADKKGNKRNIWTNLKHADDEEQDEQGSIHQVVEEKQPSEIDFLEECRNLKKIITGQVKAETKEQNCDGEKDRLIIKAKRKQDKIAQNPNPTDEPQQKIIEKPVTSDTIAESNTGNEVTSLVCEEQPESSNKVNILSRDMCATQVCVSEEEECSNSAKEIIEKILSTCLVDKVNIEEASGSSIKENFESLETDFDKSGTEEKEEIKINIEEASDSSVKENFVSLETEFNKKLTEEKVIESDKLNDEDTGAGKMDNETKREIPIDVPVEEEPRREFLLASSGKEGNIYIWRAGTDGRMQTFLSVPNKSGQRKFNKSNPDKVWIVLCWVSPTILLSSSKSAELIKWTLPKPKDKGKQFSVLHCDHNSILFSIAAPTFLVNEFNWLEEKKLNAWTVGHDRLLLNTSLNNERKNLACYPTLGNAECLAPSPLDPNRLAIGTAEGVIKVWDLSRPNIKHIVMTSFFQKIQSKVVALAWHPNNELILAYGTLEGRVGFMDTSHKSKTPVVPPNFFKSQIHKIEWGPVNENKDLGLFVVAEGKLVYYIKQSDKVPTEVDTPDDVFIYTFAWKPDHTMLLVGTKTGAVIVYSTELKILSTHYFQHRLKDIYWHPDAVQSDLDSSVRSYWFAAISNSKDVIVCNFQSDVEDGDKIFARYEISEEVVNCVAWSPYTSSQLVISADNGTAQVWNVDSNTIMSTYRSPNFEGVLSSIWSPVNSDYIISAVKDHTIKVWSITEHPAQDDKEIRELRKKVIKEISNEQTDLLPKSDKTHEELPKSKKILKTNLLPNFFYPKDGPQVLSDLRKLFLWKEGLYDKETEENGNSCDILKIFGSRSDMLNIIEQNEVIHQEKGKFSLSDTLSLFKGDISTKIRKSIDERRVNPWIIMMAPMVSPKLWLSACEVYAGQLSEKADSDPIETATFYLACHKVEEAINVLCEATMYREALALAKCRLPEDDNVTVIKIMEKWAKQSVFVGNFEIAAQCYIYLGKYEDAASVLFRRSDVETLKFALELAEKSGNEELHKAVLYRYNAYRNENNSETNEIELPSKMDIVLKHLENDCEDHITIEKDNTVESSELKEIELPSKVDIVLKQDLEKGCADDKTVSDKTVENDTVECSEVKETEFPSKIDIVLKQDIEKGCENDKTVSEKTVEKDIVECCEYENREVVNAANEIVSG